MFFRKVSQYFELKNNHLLVFVLSFYSLIAIVGFSSSITLLPSYSQQENQQQEEYILIREWGSQGFSSGQFSQPADVAVDSKDNVFVTDITARSNSVQKFNQNGTFISSWGPTGYGQGSFARASDIATDAQDNVYVVDANNPDQAVQKFTNNGTFITAWGSYGFGDGQFINPIGISVDSKVMYMYPILEQIII
jgi:DNA-binding beta-propeller fold protein YncE